MKEKKVTRAKKDEADLAEWKKRQDEFDKNRLKHICEFVFLCYEYRKLSLHYGYGDLKFTVEKFDDGEFKFIQETYESRDNVFAVPPSVNIDCDSDSYGSEIDTLLYEIEDIERKIAERNRLLNLKETALAKLTGEERKVLGL